MSSNFRVDSFALQAQRHVYPLYRKDGRGGYEFSSTMTFVKFEGQFFLYLQRMHYLRERINWMK